LENICIGVMSFEDLQLFFAAIDGELGCSLAAVLEVLSVPDHTQDVGGILRRLRKPWNTQ
jgi:hypothetical protein